jgi:gliding motility-associated-like protein
MRPCLWLILLFLSQWATTLHNRATAQTCPPNIDFESGTFDGWTCYTGYTEALNGQNVITMAPGPPQQGRHTMFTANSTNEVDPYGKFPVNCPNGSGHSIMLGNNSGGHEADGISYEFTIPAGQNSYRLVYHYAVVFQQPRHEIHQQPRMEIEVMNVSDNMVIGCASFTFIAFGSTLPGFQETTGQFDTIPVLYKDWTAVSVDLSGNAGKTIRLFFKTTDCTFNRHFGYAYIDINSECDGKITGADYCPDDTAVNIVAPYGYESYTWYNETQTRQLGNGQILRVQPPPAPNTIFAVKLFPYPGYGCDQTLLVKLNNTLSVKANAGPDTITCNKQAVRLGSPPKPGLVYSWHPANGLSDPFTSNPFANPDTTTTYYLTARSTGGGCISPDTVVVKASVLNNSLQLAGKEMYCLGNGDSAVLIVEPTDNIRWFQNNAVITGANTAVYHVTATGTYYALLHNNDGCTLSTPTKAINISTVPYAGFSINSSAQCLTGNRFVLTNNSNNEVGNMQYLWALGDGARSSAQNPDYSYARAGKYGISLVVSSSPVCADTAFADIEVYQNAVADFSVKPTCTNLPLQITNLTLDTLASPVRYQWTFGNGQSSSLRQPEPPVYSSAGNYRISLAVNTDQCPLPYHIATQVVAVDQPKAGISYPVKYALINTPLRLQARSIGETAEWIPAFNLNNNKSFTPLFTGALEQQYEIKITAASGCITVDTQLVKTVKEVTISVPTAFTPNNDGRNDWLRPTVFGIKELRYFKVFNRWGQLVFQTSVEGKGWDGNLNGMPQATETYVWVAEVTGGDNKLYSAKGTSVLIR